MNKEELIEVLRQFDEKRVEELPEKTRNIFYAIMEIADERDRLNNIINELSKDVDMWNKKYNEQFNIINELEKWLEDNLGNCRTNQNYTSNQIYNLKEDNYCRCLDKLKELKECDKE